MTTTFNPEEVINLVSSDVEPSPNRKRPLEDESGIDASPSFAPFTRDIKRPRIEAPAEIKAPTEDLSSAEEGEIEEIESDAKEDRPFASQSEASTARDDSQDSKQATQKIITSTSTKGWNTSISKTIARTSLGQPVSKASIQTDAPVFRQDSLDFKLPSLSEKKEGSWLDRFRDWASSFQINNSAQAHAISPTLVFNAYTHYIDTHSGLKPKKRKSAKQASKEVESSGTLAALLQTKQPSNTSGSAVKPAVISTMDTKKGANGGTKSSKREMEKEDSSITPRNDDASDSEVEYEPWMSKAAKKDEAVPTASEWASLLDESANASGKANGVQMQEDATSQDDGSLPLRNGVPTGSDALEQQRRYFPSASDPSKMCLLCGRETHTATSCPTLVCKLCNETDHSEFYCPSRIRCEKCRQMGHRKSQCTEKLALTKDEGLACALCNSSDHLETACTEPWRSFHPEDGNINKVASILASCSLCGNNKHFSADCPRRRSDTPNPTWSVRNRDQYVDPDCGQLSIEEAITGPGNAGVTRGSELKIRGHAARTTNVHYSSDDSEVEFLGKRPVKQRAPLGQIRMASNIQMPQDATPRNNESQRGYNLRSRGQAPIQPPLPPGPPPSGPPSRQGSFGYPPPPGVPVHDSRGLDQPPGMPHPLPARPPTRDYRNVPPPPHLRGADGQSRQQNDRGNASQGSRGRGGQRGSRGGRGGGRGRGRGRGK